jgi:hypothetical protein
MIAKRIFIVQKYVGDENEHRQAHGSAIIYQVNILRQFKALF